MMRKLYTVLLLLIITSFGAKAQRSVNLSIRTEVSLTGPPQTFNFQPLTPYQKIKYDGQTKYWLGFRITNWGPDTLLPNDTLHIICFNGIHYRGTLSGGLQVADSVALYPSTNPNSFPPPPNVTLPFTDTVNWCDSIWLANGPTKIVISDPDMANNESCQIIVRDAIQSTADVTDINTSVDNLAIYPNPATNRLNVKADLPAYAKDVQLLLRNAIGQIVYSYAAGDTNHSFKHSIDISNMPPGIYTAELRYSGQSTIKKLIVQ